MSISLSPFAPEKFVSRGGFRSPVPRQPAHVHTQAESGAYLRDSSRVSRRRPFGHHGLIVIRLSFRQKIDSIVSWLEVNKHGNFDEEYSRCIACIGLDLQRKTQTFYFIFTQSSTTL